MYLKYDFSLKRMKTMKQNTKKTHTVKKRCRRSATTHFDEFHIIYYNYYH